MTLAAVERQNLGVSSLVYSWRRSVKLKVPLEDAERATSGSGDSSTHTEGKSLIMPLQKRVLKVQILS